MAVTEPNAHIFSVVDTTVLDEKLAAIANAIRGKTGSTDPLTLDQMPVEITGISGGGTGEPAELWAYLDRTTLHLNRAEWTRRKGDAIIIGYGEEPDWPSDPEPVDPVPEPEPEPEPEEPIEPDDPTAVYDDTYPIKWTPANTTANAKYNDTFVKVSSLTPSVADLETATLAVYATDGVNEATADCAYTGTTTNDDGYEFVIFENADYGVGVYFTIIPEGGAHEPGLYYTLSTDLGDVECEFTLYLVKPNYDDKLPIEWTMESVQNNARADFIGTEFAKVSNLMPAEQEWQGSTFKFSIPDVYTIEGGFAGMVGFDALADEESPAPVVEGDVKIALYNIEGSYSFPVAIQVNSDGATVTSPNEDGTTDVFVFPESGIYGVVLANEGTHTLSRIYDDVYPIEWNSKVIEDNPVKVDASQVIGDGWVLTKISNLTPDANNLTMAACFALVDGKPVYFTGDAMTLDIGTVAELTTKTEDADEETPEIIMLLASATSTEASADLGGLTFPETGLYVLTILPDGLDEVDFVIDVGEEARLWFDSFPLDIYVNFTHTGMIERDALLFKDADGNPNGGILKISDMTPSIEELNGQYNSCAFVTGVDGKTTGAAAPAMVWEPMTEDGTVAYCPADNYLWVVYEAQTLSNTDNGKEYTVDVTPGIYLSELFIYVLLLGLIFANAGSTNNLISDEFMRIVLGTAEDVEKVLAEYPALETPEESEASENQDAE